MISLSKELTGTFKSGVCVEVFGSSYTRYQISAQGDRLVTRVDLQYIAMAFCQPPPKETSFFVCLFFSCFGVYVCVLGGLGFFYLFYSLTRILGSLSLQFFNLIYSYL